MRKTSLNFSQSEMLRKVALVALMLAIQAITGIGAGVLFAQNVTGQVVSASDQEPLIGASVKVEGTSIGSLTDIDGNFTVSARGGQTLVVSSIGCVAGLGFADKMELSFTIHSLFAVPQF